MTEAGFDMESRRKFHAILWNALQEISAAISRLNSSEGELSEEEFEMIQTMETVADELRKDLHLFYTEFD